MTIGSCKDLYPGAHSVLAVAVQNWTEPEYPSVGEQINMLQLFPDGMVLSNKEEWEGTA